MAQELGPAASSELEQSIIYNEESISFSQFVEEENDEDGSTHEDSDDEEDDGEDGEGDYVGRADKPYNPESDANSKFSFPKSKRIKLNIEAFYTRLWGGREAYREFYQNWSVLTLTIYFDLAKTTLGWTVS
jgi:hypothetical protein